jgi:hypothetical protein
VTAHRVNLGDERDAKLRIGFRESNGGAQSRAARPDDRYVSVNCFHHPVVT